MFAMRFTSDRVHCGGGVYYLGDVTEAQYE